MSRNPIPLLTVLLCATIFASAQKPGDYRLLLKSGVITPEKNISSTVTETFNRRALPVMGKRFTVIQFDHIPTSEERFQLSQSGIELLDYIPNNAYTATIRGNLNAAVLTRVKARSVIELKPEQKMFPSLAQKQFPSWAVKVANTVDVVISFPKTFSYEEVSNELKAKNFYIVSEVFKDYRIITVRSSQQRLTELASYPFVEYVQPEHGEDEAINYRAIPNGKGNVLQSSIGRNLSGNGVVMGIGDDSEPLSHIDFAGRVINHAAAVPAYHGTHVIGIAAGAGNRDELMKGYATKATIVSQVFSGILANAPAYVNDYGMVITNNSYGNIVNDCATFGIYDIYSRVLDQMSYDFPQLINVFGSGNSGNLNCSPYPAGFSNVLGGFQTAKNVISVGNTTELTVLVSSSSKGPVRDGRIKPEITAQGQFIVSSIPTNAYGTSSGTSMSSPGVAGGLALLYERYKQLNSGNNPKSGLMKALLCNGATDLGNNGPDYRYGFGWMNLLRSAKMLENTNYFNDSVANTITNTHTIAVPANTAQLKVMLYWNDPAAAVLATQALVNDLDLEVVDPFAAVTLPKLLNPTPSNVNLVATSGKDHINNIEQVVIDNPVAGNYTVRIIGNAIVQNPRQEYFLVYDTIPVSTTITHPIGAEHFSQGDFYYITWDSYGNPANTFTVEYSADDGATWNLINNNVAATSRQLAWTVPNIFTHQARVRVTRNGTGMISTSEKFTIVGVPTVTAAAVQCEGYFAINWATIPEATGYEVMMLRGVEMQTVATVPNTQTSYTFSGLSKDSVYWVTVRSILNGTIGRRAVAISRQPNSGTCAGTVSDNDLKVDAVIVPVSGRELTSTALGANTIIRVRIKNLDDAAINNFNVKYSVDGGAFVSQPNTASIGAGATYTHDFIGSPYNFSPLGQYDVRIVVENTSAPDPVSLNDTLRVIVKHLANPPVPIPPPVPIGPGFVDNIETADSATYYSAQTGLGGLDRYDFVSTNNLGRLRTFVNSGIAYSGNKALTLDADRFNIAGTADSIKGTFNLAAYDINTDDIRLDFLYKHHGQLSNPANQLWVRGDDQKPWIPAYDLYANQDDPGIYKKSSSIELSDLLAANSQVFSSSFQARWGQWGQIIAADNEAGAGYTFDDIHLYRVADDIQMIRIDTPITSSCGLGAAVPVMITVRNSANTTINNIPVKFRVDGGAITTETIASIAGNTLLQYTFTATANLSANGNHSVEVWVDYTTDSFRENDTSLAQLYNSPVISTFPYLENFESGNGSWYTGGKKSSWEYGTPASQKINRAASGSKAWKTKLAGNYNDLEQSFLYSPCFDISTMTSPTLSFNVALDLEDCGAQLCDAAFVEYSPDGKTWTRLGAFGSGTNWYNKNGTGDNVNIWSIQNYTRWHVATVPLPVGYDRLRVRFVMSADPYTSREGIAVDDIHIYDNIYGIYNGVTMGTPVTQTISGGTNWVDFMASGKLVASIQPNNQNMGSTDVQAYINSGPVRNYQSQYYHDRNITIKPATVNLTDSATVRFYFLDTETEALINATGCGGCTKPAMVTELGVSKFSSTNDNIENGTVLDDAGGNWLFVAPPDAVKVPFDRGYYTEFKVKDFSEFWLNDGGFNNLTALPVDLQKFTAVKKGNEDVLLEWTVSNELNVSYYELQLARGYDEFQHNNFIEIGKTTANNSAAAQQYSFTDKEKNKAGVRYYRLKIVDRDGKYTFSQVRAIVFTNDIKWQVYPNPSSGLFSLVYQLNEGEKLIVKVYDVNGKLAKTTSTAGTGFVQKLGIDLQSPSFAPGLYLVEVMTGEKKQLFKIIKQ